MGKSELAVAGAKALDGRFMNDASPAGLISEEFWCSSMRKDANGVEKRKSSSVAAAPVCGKLRLMFDDDAAAEPMPDVLASLFDRLDTALERGELFGCKAKLPRG